MVMGFVHDWANPENTMRSWDLFARYVAPELNGHIRGLQGSADFLEEKQKELMKGATAAVVAKIQEDPRAAAALKVTMQQAQKRDDQGGGWRPNEPDLKEEATATDGETS